MTTPAERTAYCKTDTSDAAAAAKKATSATEATAAAKKAAPDAIAAAKKTEAADKVTLDAATAKTDKVKGWVKAVDGALTNDWGVTDQTWLTTWKKRNIHICQNFG